MDYIDLFIRRLASKKESASKNTIKNYLADIRHFINWYEKSMKSIFEAKNVTSDIISLYEKSMGAIIENSNVVLETRLGAVSMKRHISSLRKFFQVLKEEHAIENNPFDNMQPIMSVQPTDFWHLKSFKDYLIFEKASKITVKSYISDILGFAKWYEQAVLPSLDNPLTSAGGFYLITQNVLDEYKSRLVEIQNAAPRTINRKLSALRKYLDFASKKGFIDIRELTLDPYRISEAKAEEILLPQVKLSEVKPVDEMSFMYSGFPPIRLLQRLFIFPYLLLEDKAAGIIAGIIAGKPAEGLQKLPNKISLELERKNEIRSRKLTLNNILGVGGIKKDFYQPNKVSLLGQPLYKKIIHHARYTRPSWYHKYHNYAFVHYVHFALLIIFAAGVGVALYNNLVVQKQQQASAAPASPSRVLSFQGRLTDNLDNPITSSTRLRFMIYNSSASSGSAELWEEARTVTPDQDGIFSVLLGADSSGNEASVCGAGTYGTFPPASPYNTACLIPPTVFSDNSAVWLGVTVQSTSELSPRQRVATVAYASNSQFLQGLQPITSLGAGDAKINTVLALDSSGNLTIGGSTNPAPVFQATDGQFTLSGKVLYLRTMTGTDTNIVLSPDGLGKIDVQKGLINSTTMGNLSKGAVEVNDKFAILATESAVAAFVLNNNTTGGDIFTASSSGTTRLTIQNDGTLVSGKYTGNSGAVLYTNGTGGTIAQSNAGINGQCLNFTAGVPTWGGCGGTSYWNFSNGAIYPIYETADVLIGGTSTASAKFRFINNISGTPVASISANSGDNALFVSGDGTLGTTNRQNLTIGNSSTYNTTGNTLINPNGAGRLGIFTSNPLTTFDLRGPSGTQTTASISANTTGAALLIDNSGPGDFLTASKAGQTFFQLNSGSGTWGGTPYAGSMTVGFGGNGKITAAVVDPIVVGNQKTTGTQSLTFLTLGATNADFIFKNQSTTLSTLTQAGQFQLPITGTTGGITIGGDTQIYRDGSVSDQLDLGSGDSFNIVSGALLTGGVTRIDSSGNGTFNSLTVSSCSGCLSASNSPFQILQGAIVPLITTTDFLIGGQATASAKFGVLNVNNGTPTASISAQNANAQALVLGSDGTIQTVRKNSLTIGGTTTGNITVQGNGTLTLTDATVSLSGTNPTIGATGSNTVTINGNSTGNIQFFSGSNILTNGGALTIAGNATINGTTVQVGNGSAGTIQTTSNQNLILSAGSGTINLNTVSNGAVTTGTGLTTLGGSLTVAGATTTFSNASPSITTGTNTNLTVTPNGNGSLIVNSDLDSGLLIGTSSNVIAPLSVSGGIGSRSLAILNQTNGGDILTASVSGTTRLRLANDGSLVLRGGQTSDIDTLSVATLNIGASTANTVNIGNTTSGTAVNLVAGTGGLNLGDGTATKTIDIGGNDSSAQDTIRIATNGTASDTISIGNNNASTTVAITGGASWGITTGGALTVTSCTGCGGVSSTNSPFEVLSSNGAITQKNTTLDLLLGGIATTSAKFAVLNIGNGTPAASVSSGLNGAAAYIDANGNFATTKKQTLTIGSSETGSISLGTDATARTINIGNSTGATALNLNAGTGSLALSSTSTGDITLNSADTLLLDSAGVLELNSSAGVISIGNDAVNQNINLGTAGSRSIAIGNATANTAVSLTSGGTGDITINSADTLLLDSVGVLELNSSAGVISIGNDSVAQNINIGNGSSQRGITIGNITSGTSIEIAAGTGGINIGDGTPTKTIDIGGNDSNAADTVRIATNGSSADTITIGNSNASTTLALTGGTSWSIGTTGTITSASVTGISLTGSDADIAFSGSSNHDISASSGILRLGALTLLGDITGGNNSITGLNNLSAAGTVTFSGFTGANNGGVIYANSSGVLSQTAAGSTSQCLLGGATPSFGSCTSTSSSPFEVLSNNGFITQKNITLDLLLGGLSTASAKFAVLNINGSNTPTASISAQNANNQALVLGGDGTIQTVRKNSLTIGGSTTGNITIQGNGTLSIADATVNLTGTNPTIGATGSNTVTLNGNSTGNIQFFSSSNILTNGGALTIAGNATINGTTVQLGNGSTGTIQTTSNQNLTLSAGSGTINLNTVSNGAVTTGNGLTTLGGNLTVAGATTTFSNASPTITTGTNTTLSITPNGSGNISLTGDADSQVLIGSSGTTTEFPLLINNGIGSNASFAVNNPNGGDLFTASASGTTRFRIANDGSVVVRGGQTSDIDTLTATTLNIGGSTANTLNIGNATVGTAVNLIAGTGGINLGDGTATKTIDIGGNDSSAQDTIRIATNGTASDTLTIGNNNASTTVAITGGTAWGITTGGALTVTSCTGCGGVSLANSPFEVLSNNGAITEKVTTLDLLLGSTSSTSAKFAVLNLNNGTPTASVSSGLNGVAAYIDANGNFATTKKQTLTVGTTETGSIAIGTDATARTISLGNTTGASTLNLDSGTGNINIGNTIAKTISIGNNTGATALNLTAGTGSLALASTSTGDITLNSSDTLLLDSAGVLELNSSGGVISIGNDAVNQNINIGTAGTRTIAIGNTSSSTALNLDSGTNGINIGDNTVTKTIDLGGNDSSAQDTIRIATNGTASDTITIGNNNASTTVAITGGTAWGVTTGGALTVASCTGCGGVTSANSPFEVITAGTITQKNTTLDLLLGGISTASAKFAVLNVAGGTPTASISAQNANNQALVLGGDGTIQTVRKNSLTIGGSTTGNITVQGNGTLSLADATVNLTGTNPTLGATGSNTVTINGNSTGNIQFFSSSNTLTNGGALTIAGNATINGTTVQIGNGSAATFQTSSNQNLTLSAGSGTINLNTVSNGAVTTGTGLTTLGGSLTVAGATTTFSNASPTITTNTNTSLSISPNGSGNINLTGDADSQVLIGATSATTEFPLFVNSNIGSNATLAINNTNSGDLFTASTSGTTRFRIANDGSVVVRGGQTSDIDTLTATTLNIGASTANTLNLGNATVGTAVNLIAGTGGLNLGDGTATKTIDIGGNDSSAQDTIRIATNGTASDTISIGNNNASTTVAITGGTAWGITTGGALTVASCTGCGGVSSTNSPFEVVTAGTITQKNTTLDLLLGGISTASAKFAVLNVAGGTPTASVSAQNANNQALVLGGDGTIQTVRKNSLTIGGNTTGNITIQGNGTLSLADATINLTGTNPTLGATGSNTVTLNGNSTGNIQFFSSSNILTNGGALTIAGNATINGTTVQVGNGSAATIQTTSNQNLTLTAGSGTLNLNTVSNGAVTTGNGLTTLGGNLTVAGATTTFSNASPSITTSSNATLSITPNGSGNISLTGDADSQVLIGASGTTTEFPLFINNGIGSNASLAVNNPNGGDLFVASTSGTTRFRIANDGSVVVRGGQTSDIDTLSATTLNIGASTATTLNIGNTTGSMALNFLTGTGGINLGDGTATKTIDIGGNDSSAQDTIRIASNGTASDTLTIGNNNAATTVTITGGTAWGITSGGALTVASCTGCGGGASGTWVLDTTNKTHYPINNTVDLVIGGISTASAKFAVLNLAGGIPIATVSGNFIVMPNNGGGGKVGIGTTSPGSLLALKSPQDNATLGSDLVTNGTFTGSAASWTLSGSWAYSSNHVTHGAGTGETILQSIGISSGQKYVITFSISGATQGTIVPSLGGTNGSTYNANYSGTETQIITAGGSNTNITFTANGNWDGTLDTVTVKKLNSLAPVLASFLGSNESSNLDIRGGGQGANSFNSFIGVGTGQQNTGSTFSTALGYGALSNFVSGTDETAIGYLALGSDISGTDNTAIGQQALPANTIGWGNTAIGSEALNVNTNGVENVAIGYSSVTGNSSGYQNVGIGTFALSTNTTGFGNTAIGYSADVGSGALTNATAIGANAIVSASNSLVLGGTGANAVQVGIGTSTPLAVLQITGGQKGGNSALIVDQTGASTNDIFTASASGVTKFVLTNSGNIGLGLTDAPAGKSRIPGAKLDLYSSLGTSPAASISANTASASLIVNNDSLVGDIFVASKSGGPVFVIDSIGDQWIWGTQHGPRSDFAEYYKKADTSEQFQAGQLVCLAPSGVTKCTSNNPSAKLLGVISDNALIAGNSSHAKDPNYVLVGMVGQLGVWVTEDVKAGDPLTYSSTPGYATKATGEGTIIGYAQEDNNGQTKRIFSVVQPTYFNPNTALQKTDVFNTLSLAMQNGVYSIFDTFGNSVNQIDAFSKAIIANLTAGFINAKSITTDSLTVATTNINIAGQSLIGFIQNTVDAYLASNPQLLNPVADNIKTNIISPLGDSSAPSISLQNSRVNINNGNQTVSWFDKNGNASFSGQLIADSIKTNSASISGALAANTINSQTANSQQLNANNASVSGTLRTRNLIADNIQANSISGLDDKIATLASVLNGNYQPQGSGSGQFSNLFAGIVNATTITADFGIFEQGITSMGAITASDVTAINSIAVGTNFTISNNAINTLGAELALQSLRQADISFEGGLIRMDTDGNMTVNGNLNLLGEIDATHGVFAGTLTSPALATNMISPLAGDDLTIKLTDKQASEGSKLRIVNNQNKEVLSVDNKGNLLSSGSATFAKLNFNLVGQAEATSLTEAVATGSAGFATLRAHQTELTIKNPNVTSKSLIYITPFGDTNNKVLYLLRQTPNSQDTDGSFTVGLSGTTSSQDIQFNWLIVN